MSRLLLASAVLLVAGTAALGQSTLADESSVVATGQGLFLIEPGQPAIQVFDTTAFGGGTVVEVPSVTWINGTNTFLVTRRDLSGHGGLWRVQLLPSGSGTIEDLTPSIPAELGRDFVDADYSVGLDTLFLLERASGRVIVYLHPAINSGAGFSQWASVPADTGVSLAVRGAQHPFTVLVVQATGEVMQVDKLGFKYLNQANNPSWSGIATGPLDGRYYLCSDTGDKVVMGKPDLPSGLPQAFIDFNAWAFCGPLAQFPLDIVLDPRANRVIALAGDFVPTCIFEGAATGKNHIMRLPMVVAGPPGNEPVLLTSTGASGIVGSHGDIAFVRHGTADITWYGVSGSGAGTSEPLFSAFPASSALIVGQAAKAGLEGAPPSAAAALVVGLVPLNLPVQGQLFGPYPKLLVPAITDAAGEAQASFAVPSVAALAGLRVYMQWWIHDTTTAPTGDMASSQVGIFTIGTP